MGSCHEAGSAEVFQVEVDSRNRDDVHVPVETAVEGEVSHLGVDGFIRAVVHLDDEVLILHVLGKKDTEGGVASVVMGEMISVEEDVR